MWKAERKDGYKDGDPMKINKSTLAQIIKEELEKLSETSPFEKEKLSTSQVRAGALDAASNQGAQGVTAEERGLIKQLSDMLVGGATQTNILSGAVITKIKQLAVELNKVIPQQPGVEE